MSTEIYQNPTMREVRERLDWEVSLFRGISSLNNKPMETAEVFRMDTFDKLGEVGARFHPLQNEVILDSVQRYLEFGNLANMGMTGRGSRLWVQVEIDQQEVTPGDLQRLMILFSNTHDGTGSFRVSMNGVRIYCLNTYFAALNAGERKRIKHTATILPRAQEVLASIDIAKGSFNEQIAVFRKLKEVKVSEETVKRAIETAFPAVKAAAKQSRTERAILTHWDVEAEREGKNFYALYHAINAYLNHDAGRGDAKDRQARMIVGTGTGQDEKVFNMVRKMAMVG